MARLQLSLFDERELAEITHPDYPNERLIVCRNPSLAAERKREVFGDPERPEFFADADVGIALRRLDR